MKHLLVSLALFTSLLASLPVAAQPGGTSIVGAAPGGYTRLPVNVTFVPGVGIGSMIGGRIISVFSLNILAGRSEQLDGAEFGGVMNWQTEGAVGAQFAGAVNLVGQTFSGVQFAGAANIVGESVGGGQFAGAVNVASGAVSGIGQYAGAVNMTGGRLDGSVQAAGAVNVAGDGVKGLQVAGVVNMAGGDVSGAQIGLINVARHVNGLQLGLVNISTDSAGAGVPIGLVSIVKGVPLRVEVWGDETGFVSAALRSGSRRWYSLLGAAVQPGADPRRWGFLAGFGHHLDLGTTFHLNIDAVNYGVFERDIESASNLSKLRVIGGWNPVDGIALFAGPTLNVQVSEGSDEIMLAPSATIYDRTVDGDVRVQIWPGAVLGIRF